MIKFATGEDDTGVLISWNTEGKISIEENADNVVVLPNSISINPLNWKLDDTYAPASENLGSLVANEKTDFETGPVKSIPKIMLFICSLLSGVIASRLSIKKCMVLGCVLQALGTLPAWFGGFQAAQFVQERSHLRKE